jgi:hypothetical protein
LGSLSGLYGDAVAATTGPLKRTGPYWEWLLHRHAFDQQYVAIDGPELIDVEQEKASVVGYAVTRRDRIVELLASPHYPTAAPVLLARACRDGIEADRHAILLHAPQSDPLHRVFQEAGGYGQHHVAEFGEVFMARVLQPLKLLRRMRARFRARAEAASLPRPFELSLLVERKKFRLLVAEREVKVNARRVSEHAVEMNVADFARMVLGQLDWDRALAEERAVPSSAEAEHFARALFPSLPFWHPPLDDLQFDGEDAY